MFWRYINLKTEKQKGEPCWDLLGLSPWVLLVANVEASAEAALMCFFQLVRPIAELGFQFQFVHRHFVEVGRRII